jgi:hypothetical protein
VGTEATGCPASRWSCSCSSAAESVPVTRARMRAQPLLKGWWAAGGDLHPGQAGSGALLALLHVPHRRDDEGAELFERDVHAAGRVAAGKQVGTGDDGDRDRDGHRGRATSRADHRRQAVAGPHGGQAHAGQHADELPVRHGDDEHITGGLGPPRLAGEAVVDQVVVVLNTPQGRPARLGHHRHAPPWSRSRPAVWPSTTATAMATVVGGGLGSSVRSCQPCRSASTASSLPTRGSTARRL